MVLKISLTRSLAYFLLMIIFFSVSVSSSSALENEPVYSVTLFMPTRSIYGSQTIEVKFTIVGLGNFSYGSIMVLSDAENIITHTLKSQIRIKGIDYKMEGPIITIGNVTLDERSHDITATIENITHISGERVIINGRFNITTEDLKPFDYKITCVLLLDSNGIYYAFTDSITYRVKTFEEIYYPIIVPIVIINSLIELIKYFVKKKWEKPRAKERGKTHHSRKTRQTPRGTRKNTETIARAKSGDAPPENQSARDRFLNSAPYFLLEPWLSQRTFAKSCGKMILCLVGGLELSVNAKV